MILQTEHLTKKYKGFTAVEDVNLSIPEGKIYGLLGPNGAGKSTTMNMLTGYTAPTVGSIRINGYNLLDAPEKAKAASDYIVVGRPITAAADPVAAYERCVKEFLGE